MKSNNNEKNKSVFLIQHNFTTFMLLFYRLFILDLLKEADEI